MPYLTSTLVVALLAVTPFRAHTEPLTLDSVVLRPMVEAEVPARHTGVLATISVEEGAAVKAGDVLAALDDRAARLAVAKADLEREQVFAKANNELRIQYADKALEVARAEMKRSSESNEQFARSISQSQLDVERLTVEKLELERKQAEHDIALEKFELRLKENALDAARLELELHAIKAPFAGVVALVRGRPGEWMQPGAVVLRLVAIDKLRAEGFAPAAAANEKLLGSKIQFVVAEDADAASKAAPVEGVLRFISPEIDPVSRQVRVWAEIENKALQLRPGQQGQLIIPIGKN
jgi:macrolide-specific efflux system membrane fusion protein